MIGNPIAVDSDSNQGKTVSAIAKLEEFFSENYKESITDILEEYLDKRSLIVNYNDLKKFDIYLAKQKGYIYEPESNYLKVLFPEDMRKKGDVL